MADSSNVLDDPALPPALEEATIAEAERDAEQVLEILEDLVEPFRDQGLNVTSFNWPTEFLLALAVTVRLHRWQSMQLAVEFPPAVKVLACACSSLAARTDYAWAYRLSGLLNDFYAERMAWNGRSVLHADFLLDFIDNGSALGTIAEFLWAHRHDVSCSTGTGQDM